MPPDDDAAEFVRPDPPNALGPDDFPHPVRAQDVPALITVEYG